MIRTLDETTVSRLARRNTILYRAILNYPVNGNYSYYGIIEDNKLIKVAITMPSGTEFNKYDVLLGGKDAKISKIGTIRLNDEKSIKNLIRKQKTEKKEAVCQQ